MTDYSSPIRVMPDGTYKIIFEEKEMEQEERIAKVLQELPKYSRHADIPFAAIIGELGQRREDTAAAILEEWPYLAYNTARLMSAAAQLKDPHVTEQVRVLVKAVVQLKPECVLPGTLTFIASERAEMERANTPENPIHQTLLNLHSDFFVAMASWGGNQVEELAKKMVAVSKDIKTSPYIAAYLPRGIWLLAGAAKRGQVHFNLVRVMDLAKKAEENYKAHAAQYSGNLPPPAPGFLG